MRTAWALLLAFAFLLAGCSGGTDGGDPRDDDDVRVPVDLLAGPALWRDPQNAPHPAYGWATLSHPPAGFLPRWWQPVPNATLPDAVTGLEHVAQADIPSGGGTAVFGSLAFVPGFFGPSHVLDISDPANPQVLSEIEASHRGAAIIAYPDGRLVAAVSTDAGFDVIDITDPAKPEELTSVQPTQAGHKLGVVPGTPILYNAASAGGGLGTGNVQGTGVTEIYDLSDPSNPVHVQDFANGYSCHHVFFWNDPAQEKYRAICAGIEVTQIWDTADPKNPSVIVDIPVHHGQAGTPSGSVPLFAFSHTAMLSMDGTVLVVGDEMGGGSVPPGCGAGLGSVGGDPAGSPVDPSTPLGALWFYDVSTETDPVLQGWFSPGHHLSPSLASCTAHHGRLVPAEGRDLLAMAFYGAGVVLVDFTDPTTPQLVDQFNEGTDTWEVWYNQGYLFTGDLARGLDVFRLV